MDYNSHSNETRTDAEQSETVAEFRVIHESPQRAEDGRLYYFEHQVQRVRELGERPFLDSLPMNELRALLAEILDYTGICSVWDYPLPPAGLPGFLHSGYNRDSAESDLLELGIRYVYAVANNERRAMHNRWHDAEALIRRIESKAEERVREEYTEAEVRRCLEREEEMAVAKLVYFIGAASGPIKIGIAVRPMDRLRGLQTGHHEPLELWATCEGGEAQERAYHKLFAGRRLKGEWFERCPEIEAEIARLQEPGV